MKNRPAAVAISSFLISIIGLGGCAGSGDPVPPARVSGDLARSRPIFDGATGANLTWSDLLTRVGGVDVVLVGERHDDATGHAVQLALVEDALRARPGGALSLEMLERDEQPLVDDYGDGILTRDQFATRTFSTNWGASGGWAAWYQPIVDAAHETGAPVVAANAPRRYVRLARTDGYERLASLGEPRTSWYDLPHDLDYDAYLGRFREAMGHGHGEGGMTDEQIEESFRSQLIWDATMAESIARAHRAGAAPVIHLVGGFHVEFDGGTAQELRARASGARTLVISLVPESATMLRDEDRDRADVVVYTGG